MQKMKFILKIFIIISIMFSQVDPVLAAELILDKQEIVQARVIEVVKEEKKDLPGTELIVPVQLIKVEILEGEKKGQKIEFENDYSQLEEGDKFYLRRTTKMEGTEYNSVADPYRLNVLFLLALFFIALTIVFGGIQGVRGLVSLLGSLLLIAYALLPAIFAGYSPLLVSILVSFVIIILGSYVTHGFNRTTSAAVLGMMATVLVTGLFGYFVMKAAKLSGYSSDEVAFLALNFRGNIDVVGLLFSGIMIGLLGVLYDAAIGQAIAVEELMRAGKHLTAKEVYFRALRIGREHIGALVDTLAIAYVGASLPLLLLFYGSSVGILVNLNSEIIATEVVRTLIGSIGLILAVPTTTFLAVYILKDAKFDKDQISHHHHHSH